MKIIALTTIIAFTMSFSGCSSQKRLQEEMPFTIGNATSQEWIGGRKETGRGYTLTISANELPSDVTFKEVYYRGEITALVLKDGEDNKSYEAKFNSAIRPDIIMDADSKKEGGNEAPSLSTKDFPFELEKDEAVISYIEDGKKKYFKISAIKEKRPLIYPAAKPRN